MNNRKFLTPEEAIEMLPNSATIHTFRQAGAVLLGCDWNRSDIEQALNDFKPELSGETATAMKHGIVFEDSNGYVFVETRDDDNE